MSHFTVLVIGPRSVDDQLTPYYEEEGCPSPKWDWFQIGGRWSGFFKLKPGALGQKGERSLLATPGEPEDPMSADIARKGDIDFEGMRDAAGNAAAARFDEARALIGDLPQPEDFDAVRTRHGENIDAAREEYWAQPGLQAIRKMLGWSESPQVFWGEREAYIKDARDNAILTHAVVKDGEWYEHGEMGWWGIVSNEKPDDEWRTKFNELVDGLPDTTVLTLVDCHI
jgi:hypothetical protein